MVALQNTEVGAEGGLSPLKAEICRRLSQGQTLRQMEREDWCPTRETIRQWRGLDAGFDLAITHAQQLAGAAMAEEAIERARACANDTWASDRVAIDTLKWAASKFYPKMFGEQSPRTLHQTYVAGDVKVVADEGQRKAMIDARQKFLKPGDKPGDKPSPDA